MTVLQIATAVIVVVTLVGVAIGRWPWLRMNRATIALVGATALVALGVIPLEQAFRALAGLAVIWAVMVVIYRTEFAAATLANNLSLPGAAMATTLAGNLTLLGSVADLIVAEIAKRRGVHLSFFEYLKAGTPIAILTLIVGVLWLSRQDSIPASEFRYFTYSWLDVFT